MTVADRGVTKDGRGNVSSWNDEIDLGGKDNHGAYTSSDVDIAEILIYNKALSSADRQLIHDYLEAKYGL